MKDKNYLRDFYSKIASLDDARLIKFLEELEVQMTDTAEFNFYGAHQIDFSSINSITFRAKVGTEHSLVMSEFIQNLQSGNHQVLEQVQTEMPFLFQSYRFVDYLVHLVEDEKIKADLHLIREKCSALELMQATKVKCR